MNINGTGISKNDFEYLQVGLAKCGIGYKLLKYYEDDEERTDIPDVLEYLDTQSSKYEDLYEEMKEDVRLNGKVTTRSGSYHWFTPNDVKRIIKVLSNTRQRIIDEDYEWYAFRNIGFGIRDFRASELCTPIILLPVDMYTPYYNEDEKKWTGKLSDTPALTCLQMAGVLPGDRKLFNGYVHEYDIPYTSLIATSIDAFDSLNWAEWKVCKNCQSLFIVSVNEKMWLADKGFKLPTHCPRCRKEKRKQRYQNDD